MANFRPSISDVQSVQDPLQAWNWNLLIPIIPGTSDTRDISWKTISTSLPGHQIEQVALEAHGVKVNFAGRRTWSGTWNATMFESRTSSTRGALITWMELARSWRNNSGQYKSTYATTGELQLFDDIPNIVRSIRLYGLFPTSIEEVNLDQSSSIIQMQCTFSYDWTEEFAGSGD